MLVREKQRSLKCADPSHSVEAPRKGQYNAKS